MHYLECNKAENGFFGEYGSFMHKILEKYAKGELSLFELNQYYEDNFMEAIPHDAPPNKYVDIKQSYYDKGIDYLDNIDLDLDKYEILGVEMEVHFKIEDKDFIGFIDLLVKDKETEEIIIIDHKSSSIKILKNGSISKSDRQHFLEFCRQMYLYSIPIIEKYGKVSKLRWNMFKDKNWIEIPWEQEGFDEAVKWAKDTLELIEKEVLWLPNNNSYYYCNYLCGQRNNACEYKPQPINKKADDEYYNPDE